MVSVFAQNKCKYDVDQVDRFSKEYFRQTKTVTLWKGLYKEEIVRCAAVNDNGKRGIAFSFIGPASYTFSEADSLMILLGDSSIVTLKASLSQEVSPFSEVLWENKETLKPPNHN